MAQTLFEERDLNSPKELFEDAAKLKPDPEMVQLATQLIQRQAGRYDPADLEDRYETRLRAMIDAKLKGEGVSLEDGAEPAVESNVIDLMAALKKSLGQAPAAPESGSANRTKAKAKAKEQVRNQPGLKLPIKGGKAAAKPAAPEIVQPAAVPAKQPRKRA